jgi:hypothetical protein
VGQGFLVSRHPQHSQAGRPETKPRQTRLLVQFVEQHLCVL